MSSYKIFFYFCFRMQYCWKVAGMSTYIVSSPMTLLSTTLFRKIRKTGNFPLPPPPHKKHLRIYQTKYFQ